MSPDTGANYPAMELIGPVLPEVLISSLIIDTSSSFIIIPDYSSASFQIVKRHFQFVPRIENAAKSVVSGVVARYLSSIFV